MTDTTADAKIGDPKIEQTAPASAVPDAATAPESAADAGSLSDRVVATLNTIYDPEIPVNIYELGLVYDVDVAADGEVTITMTLTTPNCPVAGSMPAEIETKIGAIEGVTKAHVNLVWEPTWTPERMSEAAKLELGWL